MTTPLITEIARLRRADSIDAATRARLVRTVAAPSRPVVDVRLSLATALRRLATQLDGKPASTLVTR